MRACGLPIQPHQVCKVPASLFASGVVQELGFNQTMIRNPHALMIRCGLTMANISLSRPECLAFAGDPPSLSRAAGHVHPTYNHPPPGHLLPQPPTTWNLAPARPLPPAAT